jgi:hypothetical protein
VVLGLECLSTSWLGEAPKQCCSSPSQPIKSKPLDVLVLLMQDVLLLHIWLDGPPYRLRRRSCLWRRG